MRRYINAISNELTDWIEENACRASHLLVYSIVYAEEFMTQFLDKLLVSMYKVVNSNDNKILSKNIPLSFKLLGRYCMPYSYEQLVLTAIKNELASHYPFTQAGSKDMCWIYRFQSFSKREHHLAQRVSRPDLRAKPHAVTLVVLTF